MSPINDQVAHFLGCTDGLLASGHGYKAPILVRIEFNLTPDGSVALSSAGGHTGTRITRAEVVYISAEDWATRPDLPADRRVLTKWALTKAGWACGKEQTT